MAQRTRKNVKSDKRVVERILWMQKIERLKKQILRS